MRRVIFKAYINGKTVEGLTGYFHQWGVATDEPQSPYTVGIIEQEDGQVITTHPDWIKFEDVAPKIECLLTISEKINSWEIEPQKNTDH